MKKFTISLIILIILGGAAFYFGWVKAAVPPGEYGVIVSKTHGVDKEVIQDGKFRWLWYKLIPTNVKILSFDIGTHEESISASGKLPSADTYSSFSGTLMDFSYDLSGSFSFSLKPEVLPSLVGKNTVSSQDSLQAYIDSLSEKISAYVIQQIQLYSAESSSLEAIGGSFVPPSLADTVQSYFPEINEFSCTMNRVRFPDLELYQSAKKLYLDYLARQGEILMEQAITAAAEKTDAQERYDELKRYGELLTEYPVLIQYMAIEKGMDEAVKLLPGETPR